ncbi:type I methionyl aminopeptidase [Curtanaerobium respiraculi]|uniref:type I methionyl aminopeptidase n=1 Tax=Curtanaerobium respiraculi TaxID=2949669 RepID=UPI0024B3C5E8|nr:type I methionyl aminopeptidase [Curtanaerobium respiraculi]
MIALKTRAEVAQMKEAGWLSAAVLREVGMRVEPGITTLELDRFAERFIRGNGGVPTFKGYGGFPGSICASVNEQIVHGIPSSQTVLKEGDIVSIDVGASVGSWAGDNAWTFPVGEVSPEVQRLLDVTEQSMWAAIAAAREGRCIGDIGHACQRVAESAGFGVIREYTGHGIGHDMHESPPVPNFGHRHWGKKLKAGMVLAIEPMVAMGTCSTVQGADGWLVCTADGKPAAHFEKTVAITPDGPELISVEPGYKRPVTEPNG